MKENKTVWFWYKGELYSGVQVPNRPLQPGCVAVRGRKSVDIGTNIISTTALLFPSRKKALQSEIDYFQSQIENARVMILTYQKDMDGFNQRLNQLRMMVK